MEIWKDIKWREGLYRISSIWRVFSVRSDQILKLRTDRCWYKEAKFILNSKERVYRVNRLVYFTFKWWDINYYNPYKKTLVCHLNDVRDDDRVENLFLWSQKDNVRDMIIKWRYYRGNKSWNKLKSLIKQTILIRAIHKTWNYTHSSLWNKFNLWRLHIWRIIRWQERSHIKFGI